MGLAIGVLEGSGVALGEGTVANGAVGEGDAAGAGAQPKRSKAARRAMGKGDLRSMGISKIIPL
jgi:hypothetical protein